jgi:putative ABC transport system permease protein
MKDLWLVWSNLKRRKLRTGFTIASIVVAFLLFGLLIAAKKAFTAGIELAGSDRLVVQHKVSLIMSMPRSYLQRIAGVPGVAAVADASWMGGSYPEPKNVIGTFPVIPESYLAVYPEILIPPEQREAWFKDRTGAAVGRNLAERHGWKLGDRIPIRSTIYRKADGGDTWEMTVDAIYDATEPGIDKSSILMHYEYFNESLAYGKDESGWFIVKVADPARAAEVAKAIDERFANSPFETKTSTEKAFAQGFAEQIGSIGAIVTAVLSAVFFSMLLVTATTMAQAVRERTRELAVLKTVGFDDARVMRLVLTESLMLALAGGLIGLGLAYLFVNAGGTVVRRYLDAFILPPSSLLWGVAFAVALGLLAGALPAAQALRLRIVDALRSV